MSANSELSPDLLDENGKVYLHNERVLITSAEVFGILRKELIDNLSEERMRSFLFRYGWNLGKNDARHIRESATGKKSLEEILSHGPVLHMIRGYTKVVRTEFKIDYQEDGTIRSIYVAGKWLNSYEAEEHLRQFGHAQSPICYTLCGYASGYYTEITGQKIFFKEMSCKACGKEYCQYVGKLMSQWGDQIEEELGFLKGATIFQELEMTYRQLVEERNNLNRTLTIHKHLTELFLEGKNLQEIAGVVYQATGCPILIEDKNFQPLACAGMEWKDARAYSGKEHGEIFHTRQVTSEKGTRLTTPIFIKKKIYGYCTFLYPKGNKPHKVDQMILERVATICSLYILNEKNRFEMTEHIKGNFFNEIIDGDLDKDEILRRGHYVNLDLTKAYFIIAIKFFHRNKDSEENVLINETIMEEVLDYFKDKCKSLIGQRARKIIVLVQAEDRKHISGLLTGFQKHWKNHGNGIALRMGISTRGEDILEARDFYHEAVIALQMADYKQTMVFFEDLGIVGVLLQSENRAEIKRKARKLLAPILEKSRDPDDLLKTLYVFLKHGGNLEKTRKELALSLSGLRYRVDKLKQILGHDLRDTLFSYQLFLCLQVLIVDEEIRL